MTSSSLIRPADGPGRILHVTPESAGWDHVEFGVVEVAAGAPWSGVQADRETAIVPLAGQGRVHVAEEMVVELSRGSVFTEMARIVYLPPGTPYRIESEAGLRASVGSAPAEGRYPV
ncbi:MAG: 5-deoxy-glucuronate isomerase, partial [Acidimicrobiaceae bacterium]|nr:5-deoxy-glucuronate isomerase [Acidimicrobiaceae bacterium]